MNIKKYLKLLSLAAPLSLFSAASSADIAIVVNPESSITSIDKKQVANIFLGKTKKIGGKTVTAIDQDEGAASRDEFYTKVVNKSAAQLNSYWSRLIFTGKGMPPDRVSGDEEVVGTIADEPSMIGYVNVNSVDESVKVLLVIE